MEQKILSWPIISQLSLSWPITANTGCVMNQSALKAQVCNGCQTRENATCRSCHSSCVCSWLVGRVAFSSLPLFVWFRGCCDCLIKILIINLRKSGLNAKTLPDILVIFAGLKNIVHYVIGVLFQNILLLVKGVRYVGVPLYFLWEKKTLRFQRKPRREFKPSMANFFLSFFFSFKILQPLKRLKEIQFCSFSEPMSRNNLYSGH